MIKSNTNNAIELFNDFIEHNNLIVTLTYTNYNWIIKVGDLAYQGNGSSLEQTLYFFMQYILQKALAPHQYNKEFEAILK